MATVVTLQASDLITNSRADINTSIANLNSDKLETSLLSTDSSFAGASNLKIASQLATKLYVDAGGNVNASETARGIVEEATNDEVTAGTATGGTGAKLFVTPTKLATRLATVNSSQTYSVGALANDLVKTYFNMQLPFILWTGATSGALTTDFLNWNRNSADAETTQLGAFANFVGTGADRLYLDVFYGGTTAAFITWPSTNKLILDWWAKLPATGTGDVTMGFATGNSANFISAWNTTTVVRVCFTQKSSGELLVTLGNTTSVNNNDITSGITVTNWNNYRIELDLGTNALFYVNGVLKSTQTQYLYTGADNIFIGFGRSDTSLFKVTAPTLSVEMNP